MKIKINNVKSIIGLEIFISLLVGIVLLMCKVVEGYEFIFCLPFFFALILITFGKMYYNPIYNYGIGFWAINIVMFVRYTITPLMVILTNSYYGFGPNPTKDSMNLAIFLMIYEMIVAFIVVWLTAHICRKKEKITGYQLKAYTILKSKFVVVLFTVLAFFILIPYPQLVFPQELFFLSDQYTKVTINVELSGALSIISNAFKIVLLLLVLSFFKKMYDKMKSTFYVYLSGLAFLLFIGLNTGTSRWTILIWMLISVVILAQLYPRQGKLIRNIIIVVGCTSIISISMYKFSWAIANVDKPVIYIFSVLANQFQDYFSGPRVVAQAIEMKELFRNSISSSTLINDFTGSIPFISNFVNQYDRLNVYFNLHNYLPHGNTSLIIPMVGCGYTYFGLVFAPIFTAICEYGAVKFDYAYRKEQRVEFQIIYIYAAIILSLCMGFNTQIIFGFFITTFIPLWVLFYCNKKIVL